MLPVAFAQEVLDRYALESMTMVVTDDARFAPAFIAPSKKAKPVLWVKVPAGVEGIAVDEVVEREGRHGVVAFAHESTLRKRRASRILGFRNILVEEIAISATFFIISGDYVRDPVLIEGSVWYPRFDGMGPARVSFADEAPTDVGGSR